MATLKGLTPQPAAWIAKELGVHRSTITTWMHLGCPSHPLDGKRGFILREVLRWRYPEFWGVSDLAQRNRTQPGAAFETRLADLVDQGKLVFVTPATAKTPAEKKVRLATTLKKPPRRAPPPIPDGVNP